MATMLKLCWVISSIKTTDIQKMFGFLVSLITCVICLKMKKKKSRDPVRQLSWLEDDMPNLLFLINYYAIKVPSF